jgi:YkoY family integral membrane protein
VFFDFITQYRFEPIDVLTILALVVLEGVLSFDNAAVLAALTRRLPGEQRRKALLYGLIGAYVMRFAVILVAGLIIANPYLKLVGGGYLLYLGVKHFVAHAQGGHDADKSVGSILGLSVFWSTVVYIELTDLAFALDQVVATVAYTDKILLVIVGSAFAILLLRLSAFYMTRIMDWMPSLEHIAYGVVGFVGIKLIVSYWHFEVPKVVSVPLTLGAFAVPVGVKWLMERRGGKTTVAAEEPLQKQ